MKSNCYFWAWGRFVDRGGYIRIRKTRLSTMSGAVDSPWWAPLKAAGIALQWLAIAINLVGWYLRWGEWFHTSWSGDGRKFWQYVPEEDAPARAFPPLIFHGVVEQAEYEEPSAE